MSRPVGDWAVGGQIPQSADGQAELLDELPAEVRELPENLAVLVRAPTN